MSEELDAEYEAAARSVAAAARILVVAHENPDGDALGSLVAAETALRDLGADVRSWIGGSGALPREYGWLAPEGVPRTLPDDVGERLLLALDCGSARRIDPDERLVAQAPAVVNVDHHHDNTRFGTVNVVDPAAACTTLMLSRILARLGAPLAGPVAVALYVGLVTDTGRFSYSNTDGTALRFAADLVDAGVRPAQVFRDIYENAPLAKARLLGRGLERVESRLGGRLLLTTLLRQDFADTEADDTYADGVIDHLRAVEGVEVAALIREPRNGDGPAFKVSLRSSSAAVDVSRVARSAGGGGHVQAAGFSSDLPPPAISDFLERELAGGG